MDPASMQVTGQPKLHQQQQTAQSSQSQNPRKYDGKNGNPNYDTDNGGHYGASQQIALSGHAPNPEVFTGHWANVNQGLTGHYRDILNTYWQQQVTKLETDEHDYKIHQLPLARIKKVMKADPEVKMISAEAPILFAKGCDIFITELTMRAWIHAEENKRRTLQRSDIASALAKSDMFDFLIDIVPREEATSHKRSHAAAQAAAQHPSQHDQSAHAAAGGHPNTHPRQGIVPPQAVAQQTGVHPPPPHQMPPPEYAMPAHLQPDQEYRQAPGMYGAPQAVQGDPGAPYGQQGMGFDHQVYGYGMPPQQVSGDKGG
ncbi:histone-fold-containing protein [Eremomyces bilateralis CBS 781.70]|uniref:Histone-fold-containing protein n=1 Tax=Eremomyces bilateralis CBS 781.70 TaxID=1392243 RepID=A0A6G1G295_9PEZI|nr:histone-fold-containing protein [Eremomyces bilateralis CBS 781.70]KAF1812046.1 histone-fold-containing protein [Eremomyces bilateralis CBS 781.70]